LRVLDESRRLNLSTTSATNESRAFAGIGRKGDSMGGFVHPSRPLAAYPAAILLAATMPQLARHANSLDFQTLIRAARW